MADYLTRLDELTDEIVRVDTVVVNLLNLRGRCVKAIGDYYVRELNIDIESVLVDRENEMLKRVRGLATTDSISADAIERIFKLIISEMKKLRMSGGHENG